MGQTQAKVIVTRTLPEPIESRMAELFDVTFNTSDRQFTREDLIEAMQNCEVLVPTLTDRIDAAMLDEAGPRLKLIANYGAGFDHIDVEAALRKGIKVSNTPGVLAEDTADMTMALILSVPRRLKEGMTAMKEGNWQGWSPTGMLGHRIGGKRLGILGMGHIGQAVARRARAFNMTVDYHNRKRLHPQIEERLGVTYWQSLDQMLARVDVLAVTIAHTPATFHLLSARRLKLMKPTAYIVNTSRGEVIDENAMTRMLRTGELAGAGLDVLEHGPAINPRLHQLPNVMVLPHMGSATYEGRIEMGQKVLINIKTYVDGHRPPDQVVPSML